MGRYFLFLCITASAVAATVWFVTPAGLGIFPDSVQYIEIAKAFSTGAVSFNVSAEPGLGSLGRFPPLFPLIISACSDSTATLAFKLRPFVALLAFLNTFVLGLLLACATPNRVVAGTLLLVGVFSLTFLRQHILLYSEPWFLLTELGMLLLVLPLGTWQNRKGVAFLASVLATAGALLRYAGLSLPSIAGLCAVIREDLSTPRKFLSVTLFSLAAIPTLAWLVLIHSIQSGVGGRSLHFTAPSFDSLVHLIARIGAILPPISLLGVEVFQAIISLTLLCVLGALGARTQLGRAALASAIFYLVFIVVLQSSIDSAIPFNDRILLPLIPFLLILLSTSLSEMKLTERNLFVVLGILILSVAAEIGVNCLPVLGSSRAGLGFSNLQIAQSEIFTFVRRLPKGTKLFSNYPEALLVHTNSNAAPIPTAIDPGSATENLEINSELAALKADLKESKGYLVWFYPFRWRTYQPTQELVVTTIGAKVEREFDTGVLYRVP